MTPIHGIFPALVTPYDANGKVDIKAMDPLVDMMIDRGVGGFFICGSTAEMFLLSAQERMEALEGALVCVAGRCPVIAHTGGINIDETIALSRHAEKAGASAVAAVAPFYFKYPFSGYLDYLGTAAGSTGLPFYFYNIPMFTHVEFTLDEMERIFSISGVSGVKNSTLDLKVVAMARKMGLTALCGHDQIMLGALAMGAAGGIGSTYNIMPEKVVKLQTLYEQGKMEDALAVQHEINAICRILDAQGGIPAIKYALEVMGLPCGGPRTPFKPLDDSGKKAIREMADRYLIPVR